MKIRFLQSVGGDRWGYDAGQVVDVDEVPFGDGHRFLKAGIAEEVRDADAPRIPESAATKRRQAITR